MLIVMNCKCISAMSVVIALQSGQDIGNVYWIPDWLHWMVWECQHAETMTARVLQCKDLSTGPLPKRD
jgi:hypothetical protein